MARRGHHSLEQIKDMVLIAAEDLIVEGGPSQLRVRNIAAKIGYTVGSIYMVFESMDELILHIKGRSLDELHEQLGQVRAKAPEQRLEELAGIYIRYAIKNRHRWCLIFEHRLPEGSPVPAWYQNKLDKVYGKFADEFATLAPDLASSQHRQSALAFLGGIQGICTFILTTHLAGLDANDLHESVVLLAKQLVITDRRNTLSEGINPVATKFTQIPMMPITRTTVIESAVY